LSAKFDQVAFVELIERASFMHSARFQYIVIEITTRHWPTACSWRHPTVDSDVVSSPKPNGGKAGVSELASVYCV